MHILDKLKELTIFSDKVDQLYGRTDTLHVLDHVEELQTHAEDLLSLVRDHIRHLEFCSYKYRGVEGDTYNNKVVIFKTIENILLNILDNDDQP
jgi:hypothetical protein